mgnify:CR=1 FL=1
MNVICAQPHIFRPEPRLARIAVDGDLRLAEQADLILLPATGSAIERNLAHNAALLPWLAQRPPAQQLASLCSSAFLLAASGLLDGRRATTHWRYTDALKAQFGGIEVLPDVLYVDGGFKMG